MRTGTLRSKLALLMLAVAPLFAGGCCPLFTTVFIPDDGLEQALRQALNKPFGCLTKGDLASLTELQAESRGIRSIEGLEHCTGLIVLNLRGNAVQSITPLTDLANLVRVDLTANAVRNIEPIAGWQNLDELQLAGELMEIVDWAPLAANVNAARGLSAGDVVVLPTATTVDATLNPLPNFANAFQALQNAGVSVVFGEVQ